MVDLIELAGQWVEAEDWAALARTLQRLDVEFSTRFPDHTLFAQRFARLRELAAGKLVSAEEVRRTYRRAAVG